MYNIAFCTMRYIIYVIYLLYRERDREIFSQTTKSSYLPFSLNRISKIWCKGISFLCWNLFQRVKFPAPKYHIFYIIWLPIYCFFAGVIKFLFFLSFFHDTGYQQWDTRQYFLHQNILIVVFLSQSKLQKLSITYLPFIFFYTEIVDFNLVSSYIYIVYQTFFIFFLIFNIFSSAFAHVFFVSMQTCYNYSIETINNCQFSLSNFYWSF